MKNLAIIPARGGSKRILGKNTRDLLGKPLLAWTSEFALSVPQFTRIVLSTDCANTLSLGRKLGLSDNGTRPDYLATDTASSIDVILYELQCHEAIYGNIDFVALLQPTSPYRVQLRWQEAWDLMSLGADSVVSVAPAKVHPEHMFLRSHDGILEPRHPEALTRRTQEFASNYYVNGSLYLIRRNCLVTHRSLFPPNLHSVLCTDMRENIDIDTEQDWQTAESLLARVSPAI